MSDSASSSHDWAPVFVLGTGRCGSTHLQRIISTHTDYWIWGEHGGFLADLLKSVRDFERNPHFAKNIPTTSFMSDDELVSAMCAASESLAWVNRMQQKALRDGVRFVINNLFSAVPTGWRGWGFKEILYGLDNDAPDILLDIFPQSRMIFSFRDPKQTIESMVSAWTPHLLDEGAKVEEIKIVVNEFANRWCVVVEYFCKLKKLHDKNLVFIGSVFIHDVNCILNALGLKAVRLPLIDTKTPTNHRLVKPNITLKNIIDNNIDKDLITILYYWFNKAMAISREDLDIKT